MTVALEMTPPLQMLVRLRKFQKENLTGLVMGSMFRTDANIGKHVGGVTLHLHETRLGQRNGQLEARHYSTVRDATCLHVPLISDAWSAQADQ